MVVATETNEGEVATVVGGMYDGHFGRVRGYTEHSVKLTLLHALARPWAKGTANERVTLRKTSVRMLNLIEMGRVDKWEKGMLARRGEPHRVPIEAGRGPEAELLAKLVGLHISAHPAGVTEGCLAFQEKLNRAIAQGLVSGVGMNA
jgi:hypothetical protein